MNKPLDVQAACVIGVPDEAHVERVRAFIALKDASKTLPKWEKPY